MNSKAGHTRRVARLNRPAGDATSSAYGGSFAPFSCPHRVSLPGRDDGATPEDQDSGQHHGGHDPHDDGDRTHTYGNPDADGQEGEENGDGETATRCGSTPLKQRDP